MSDQKCSPLRPELFAQAGTLVREVPALVHTWRFATGALFALSEWYRLAEKAPQAPRGEAEYISDTERLVDAIRDGVPPDNEWLRAFHYNAALMRIDAVYERIFRAVLGDTSKANGPALYASLQKRYPRLLPELYERSPFAFVREEANSLKHYVGGAAPPLRERVTLLRTALEHLFAFVSDRDVKTHLQREYGHGKPVSGKG